MLQFKQVSISQHFAAAAVITNTQKIVLSCLDWRLHSFILLCTVNSQQHCLPPDKPHQAQDPGYLLHNFLLLSTAGEAVYTIQLLWSDWPNSIDHGRYAEPYCKEFPG